MLACTFQGAPESLLDRCSYVRVGGARMPMCSRVKNTILKNIKEYGTGACPPHPGMHRCFPSLITHPGVPSLHGTAVTMQTQTSTDT